VNRSGVKLYNRIQHLLDAHVHVVPVKLETPVRERPGAGVMATPGAGR
jgi:hypothetical protein